MFIGIMIVIISMVRIIGLAGHGYSENIDDIAFYVFVSCFGYVFFLFGNHLEKRQFSEQLMQDAIRAKAREDMKAKMRQWDTELTEEEMNESSSSNQPLTN